MSSLSCFLSKVVSLPQKSTLIVPLTVSFFVFQRRVVADSAAPIVLADPSSAPQQSGLVKVSMSLWPKARDQGTS